MPRIVSEKHSPNKQTSAFSDLAEVIVICSKHHQKNLMTTDVSAPTGPLLPLQSQCSDCFTFRITQVSSSVTILGKKKKTLQDVAFPCLKHLLKAWLSPTTDWGTRVLASLLYKTGSTSNFSVGLVSAEPRCPRCYYFCTISPLQLEHKQE